MNFELNEDQKLLADSVRRMIERHYDFEARKKIVASAEGFSATAWATMAELGLLGLAIGEDDGGFGRGATDLVAVMEAIGEGLLLEPFAATVSLARMVERAGSEAQRRALLPAVIAGNTRLALAWAERDSRYALAGAATSARRDGEGWVLQGEKIAVEGAPAAGTIVVTARSSGAPGDRDGLSLFLVDPKAAGVTLETYRTQDSMRAADVVLRGVRVGAGALLGAQGAGLDALEEAVDFATALTCAEAVGAMKSACDATLEYLKTRKQFGVPIGAFQALQHRMVDMCISTEQARSIAYLACARVDSALDARERGRVVAAAHVKISDAARHVGQESIQLHGGMGMTNEMKVSHTFKRLTMISQAFGDADHWLERFAAASETGA
ncbi:MAG: acyl-CoA dehydrogenase family protein [Burkholderiaceae bacterium]|nr:acyl-CoA dehydrogenase family protein [Burkholderiaceae bacterium]